MRTQRNGTRQDGRPLVARKIRGHSFTTALSGPFMEKSHAIGNIWGRRAQRVGGQGQIGPRRSEFEGVLGRLACGERYSRGELLG